MVQKPEDGNPDLCQPLLTECLHWGRVERGLEERTVGPRWAGGDISF